MGEAYKSGKRLSNQALRIFRASQCMIRVKEKRGGPIPPRFFCVTQYPSRLDEGSSVARGATYNSLLPALPVSRKQPDSRALRKS